MTPPPLEVYLDPSKVVFAGCTEAEWFDALVSGQFEHTYRTLEQISKEKLDDLCWVRRAMGEYP